MKLRSLITGVALSISAMSASAGQLAGKNIILVQGFQLQHVFISRTHDDGKRFGYNYWNKFDLYNQGNGAVKTTHATGITLLDQNLPTLATTGGQAFNIYDTSKQAHYYPDANARILHFDSTYRLEGSDGIGRTVGNQLNDLFAAEPDFCTATQGCIVITHSTGDLVMQYIEDNKATLLDNNARSAFDVTTYLDLAGARGGTEGATLLYHLANLLETLASNTVLSPEKQDEVDDANIWINFFLGTENVDYLEPGKHFESGVLFNLQVGQARNTGLVNPDQIPHLRVASAGDEPYGFVTHLAIKGHDDSVVPLHSSCGSLYDHAYNSCVWNRKLDGETTWFADAPGAYFNLHFPFLQSETLRHNGHQWDDTGNHMAPLMSNGNFAGDVDLDVEKVNYWDLFLNKHIRVKNAQHKTLAQVLMESVE